MSVVYKLGEGPINYEWNIRYITFKGRELTYALTINSEEKRTINLEGAITSNICRIKGNKYSFALIIPIFQVLFFSTDSYQETVSFRDQVIQAASNSSSLKAKRANSSASESETQATYPITVSNQPLPYSSDFITKVEALRREIVFDENKYNSLYVGPIRYSFPKDISYCFWYIYTDIGFYLLKLLTPVLIAHFVSLYSRYNTLISLITFLLSLINMIMMRVSLFSHSSNLPCSYITKATTIINCNKDKVLSLLKNHPMRSEWDEFVSKPHCFKENESRISIDLVPPLMDNFWMNLLMRINELILNIKSFNPRLIFDRIQFKDKEGNDYFLFKDPESKGHSLFNESLFELFIVKSVKDVYEEKSFVVFLTNNDWRSYDMSYSIRQYMKEHRLGVLYSLREYIMGGDIKSSIDSFL